MRARARLLTRVPAEDRRRNEGAMKRANLCSDRAATAVTFSPPGRKRKKKNKRIKLGLIERKACACGPPPPAVEG